MGTAQQQPPGTRGQEGARTAFRVIGIDVDAAFCDSCGAALAR